MHSFKKRTCRYQSFPSYWIARSAGQFAIAALMVTGALNAPAHNAHFLDRADDAVLVSPRADFEIELHRLNLASSRFRVVDSTENLAGEAAHGETADLGAALKKAKLSKEDAERIQQMHAKARAALREFAESAEAWRNQRLPGSDLPTAAVLEQPPRPVLVLPEDLPAEFADYLQGALLWHDPAQTDKAAAAAAWERLLARPAAERHWKSTWAAFMLGRYWETNQPEQALAYFQQVRDLTAHGFADSIALSAGSLGIEGRIRLRQREFETAIELYLEQFAAGDESAPRSLEIAATEALQRGPETLRRLALNVRCQRMITAFLMSNSFHRFRDGDSEVDPEAEAMEKTWLLAAAAAQVRDADSAEKLAWIAYRCNEPERVKQWSKLAAGSPVIQWIEAKRLMREGKLAEAESILVRCAPAFRVAVGTNDPPPETLSDNLFICHYFGDTIAGRQILGELGVVRLARGEYVRSLDAFLRGGFWMDAAYVAERVLTAEELKGYVDQDWPPVSDRQLDEEHAKFTDIYVAPQLLREQIRFLLARRLTRSFRGDVAREYYPDSQVPSFDSLAEALRSAWDESASPHDRAQAFMRAALISRNEGMELLGTELEPDWRISDSSSEGVCWEERETNSVGRVLFRASADEIRRASEHSTNPERRFHYRYQAALLAWEAARLLPNESDETAYVLYTAGCWLKDIDPATADILYKALVRRNRKTPLGAAADLRRWFPETPEPAESAQWLTLSNTRGEIADRRALPEAQSETPDEIPEVPVEAVAPGWEYMIRPGDTLAEIVRAFARTGLRVSLEGILQSNPGIVPERIIGGQRIIIQSD
jgi:hypothetical protein